jgi:hypothetical protein
MELGRDQIFSIAMFEYAPRTVLDVCIMYNTSTKYIVLSYFMVFFEQSATMVTQ